jgi:preprotein translocase subunit YajC
MFELLAQSSGGAGPLGLLLPFLLLGGLFYFMILRPQQRRQRAQQALVNAVDVGDEIITTAGIYGVITGVDDDEGTIRVEIAPGTEIRLLRAGIGRRVTEDEDEDEDYGDGAADDDGHDVDDEDHPDQPGQIKEL